MQNLHIVFTLALYRLVSAQELNRVVNTSLGTVRGFRVDYGKDHRRVYYGSADIFLGVPFAQPPIGDLRFKLPQPICRYAGDVGSKEYMPRCPQGTDPHGFDYKTDEDCLYLNVFAPNVTDGRKRPVMFYIPGGGFRLGGADIYAYKGAVRNMVSRGVVVVVIQYRISLLGFFTTFTDDFPPNRGIYDILMAMEWVKNEISHFGGDPKRVTIFGHSAGSLIASVLSMSPLSQGYFQQLLLQSGFQTIFDVPHSKNYSIDHERADQLCNVRGDLARPTNLQILKRCFENRSAEDLVYHDMRESDKEWNIYVDGSLFPAMPHELAKRRANFVTLLGTTTDEFAFSMSSVVKENITGTDQASLRHYLDLKFDYLPKDEMNIIEKIILEDYLPTPLAPDDALGWTKLIAKVISDKDYLSSARKHLQWFKSNNNSDVYIYNFDYSSRLCPNTYTVGDWTPVVHTNELCFLWLYNYEWEDFERQGRLSQADLDVANNIGRSWTNFAKYGNPGWSPMRDDFEYVNITDMISDMVQGYGDRADWMFNKKLPALFPDTAPQTILPAIQSLLIKLGQSTRQAWQDSLQKCRPPSATTYPTIYPIGAPSTETTPAPITNSTKKKNKNHSHSHFSIFVISIAVLIFSCML